MGFWENAVDVIAPGARQQYDAITNPQQAASNIGQAAGDASGYNAAKGIWGAISGDDAAKAAAAAAAAQQSAADRATAENARQFNITQQNLAPWLQAGRQALGEQQTLMGFGGDTAGAMRALQASPGYTFRLQQGQRSLDAMRGAGGGMGGGKALSAAMDYNQNFANNEYTNRLNQLAAMSGTGQSTAGTLGNLGANYANSQGNIWTGMANAQGAAGMAAANARQSGLLGLIGAGASIYGARR